ncbi:G-type lectin S-receptor-like serine/threonine-protein kinase At2g19130 [Chenopodium quinoa]|uniref:G-type lectin S-receptor-like serine/threonine-protein kinase At2g19130 n=1 Tax=Chenopodium quinoa TaxID=63459 RepID=UPI000B770167|nr:G-type lectin S-receptor-like serine/threonine-protein kinase At2g19130 [Chenopodium quinoa]
MGTIIITKLLLHVYSLHLFFFLSFGTNTIYSGQSNSYYTIITSTNGVFELAFYTPGSLYGCYIYESSQYIDCYIVIRYNNLPAQDIVWTGNIRNPLSIKSSSPTLSLNGNLTLTNGEGQSIVIWSSRSSSELNSTKLVLEDNGNLVIKSMLEPNQILWQSFDHPTDTWLPGAKVGFNKLTSTRQVYSSNDFSFKIDLNTMSSISLEKGGTKHGSCRLKGKSFSCFMELNWYGKADMLLLDHTTISRVSNENETYLMYSPTNSSILTRFVLDGFTGFLSEFVWFEDFQVWMPSKWKLADKYCDQFVVYNRQQNNSQNCTCFSTADCVNTSPFQCYDGTKEGFLMIQNSTLPSKNGLPIGGQDGCSRPCMRDCNCEAYGRYDDHINACHMWYSPLGLYYSPGTDVYVRLATTNWIKAGLATTKARKAKPISNSSIIGAALGGLSLIVTTVVFIWKSRRRNSVQALQAEEGSLILMKYSAIRSATKNFSCKLGEGGFGTVYKGTLPHSSANIAVKDLKVQCQGEKQFRAEVSTLGTIHHSNLVRLWDFCVESSKRFLIYEYMPNGSLDKHIFCKNPRNLQWKTRYQIGLGIARGLAYLHSECRECIIHCDIKPENILLDDEYNPKIADFGLAKLLCRDFSRVLTTMRGTRGYLAPEWISGAPITSKADVYSYGMMLFEIISGRRNWSMRINGENDYFPLQVMQKLVNAEDVISLLDSELEGNVDLEELIRACRVAGWCIQENEDRLSMVNVIRIFEGVVEVVNPPIPRFLHYVAEIPMDSTAYLSCITE